MIVNPSDEKIQKWLDRMKKLGHTDVQMPQKIARILGVKKTFVRIDQEQSILQDDQVIWQLK